MSDIFRRRVSEERTERGWSLRDMADALNDLRVDSEEWTRWDHSKVAKVEHGERRATLDEAVLFAAAFNIPPTLLMMPLGSEDSIEISRKSRIHPHLALEWFTGDGPLVTTARYVIGKDWKDNARPIHLYRTLRRAQDDVHQATSRVRSIQTWGTKAEQREARRLEAEAVRHLHSVRSEIAGVKRSVRPPRLLKEWIDKMKQLGLKP